MKVGILLAGHPPDELRPKSGDYHHMTAQLLGPTAFDYVSWDVEGGEMPATIHEADAWVIPGSKHGAYEDHPWIPPLEDHIRAAHAAGQRMLGICFGHQIIAKALGGTVVKHDGGWRIGRQAYDFNGDTALYAWHQDQVVDLPDGAKVVGTNDTCENAMLVYGDQIFTVQPHPEFDAAFVDGLLKYRGGPVPEDRKAEAATTLTLPTDTPRIGQQMAQFLKTGSLT